MTAVVPLQLKLVRSSTGRIIPPLQDPGNSSSQNKQWVQ